MQRLLPWVFLALLFPADAIARAGGGSSGFGGGGGGGGGGSGGRGGADASWTDVLGLIVVGALFFLVTSIISWRAVRRRRKRVARTITASAEAAEDDAWFAADAVQQDAARLFCQVQEAWDARDRERLERMVGHGLMVEWERRLDDFDGKGWHNRVEVREGPVVEYVGLVNREDDVADRVCVRVSGSLFDVVETEDGKRVNRSSDATSDVSPFAEFWTLAREDGGWTVVSIEQEDEGKHNLEDPLIPTPWSDTQRVRDETVVELAEAGAPNGDVASLYSVEFADDARAAALDLSLVDDRYAPAVLEVAARRALAGWAEAVDGDDGALAAIAEPDALRQLLYGEDQSGRTRLVVRGPRLEAVRILELDSQSTPPSFTVEARVRGRRYVEDRDTAAVVSGNPGHETTFTQRWRLILSDERGTPWRVGLHPLGSRAHL